MFTPPVHCELCNRPKSRFEQIRPRSLLTSCCLCCWEPLQTSTGLIQDPRNWRTHGPLIRSLRHLHIVLEQLHLNSPKEPWNSSENVGNLTRTLRDSSERSHILLSLSPEVISIAHSLSNPVKYICMAMRVGTTTHKNRETDRWRKIPSHLVFNCERGAERSDGFTHDVYITYIIQTHTHTWSHQQEEPEQKEGTLRRT